LHELPPADVNEPIDAELIDAEVCDEGDELIAAMRSQTNQHRDGQPMTPDDDYWPADSPHSDDLGPLAPTYRRIMPG